VGALRFKPEMNEQQNQLEFLASLKWPDRRQRLEEQARIARSLTPDERLLRVDALSRLCLALARSAGNLEAARRYREWREAQWRRRIREVIRHDERTRSGNA